MKKAKKKEKENQNEEDKIKINFGNLVQHFRRRKRKRKIQRWRKRKKKKSPSRVTTSLPWVSRLGTVKCQSTKPVPGFLKPWAQRIAPIRREVAYAQQIFKPRAKRSAPISREPPYVHLLRETERETSKREKERRWGKESDGREEERGTEGGKTRARG